MARIDNPWTCDKCGRAKGEGNGWLIGVPIIPDIHRISGVDSYTGEYSGYAIIGWDEGIADRNARTVHHLCSEACALAKQGECLR